jgi:hypothetical protein
MREKGSERVATLDVGAVQNLIAGWWFEYDQGNFDVWNRYFTADAHFSCRSDSGLTAFEEFVSAEITGRDEVLAWQIDHRRQSPYPLRHNATNVHVTSVGNDEVDFRSYLFVTQIVGGAVSNLASGLCVGSVRQEEGSARIADLRVILDFTDSVLFDSAQRHQPV